MYGVIVIGTSVTFFGPFASLANAQQFAGSQASGSTFAIVQVRGTLVSGPGGYPTVQTFVTGTYVALLAVSDFLSAPAYYAYGTFPDLATAQAYSAGRAFPGGCTPAIVTAPPA